MVLQDCFSEVLYVHVCVNLGGGEVFVSEQLLYDPQVGSVLEQMGGKRVAESVGRNGLGDTRFGAQPPNDLNAARARRSNQPLPTR